MDTELKPCPFCGEEAGICEANDICFHRDDDGNKIFGGWRCFCPSCAIEQIGYETREEAVSAWNNRSTEHATHRAPVGEKGGGRMTGIDRLRTLAGAWDECDLGGALMDVADEIEREHVSRIRVMAVLSEMERHVSGVEGADDSPVARWARELREALGGEGHDHAADVSVSAYDLLPADEREAIAWVREHGGLDSVKKLLDWVVGHCSTRQQLDFDFWLSGRVMYELGFEEDMADRDEVERRLLARLMPEGYEWPRYESGEPLRYEDRYVYDGREREVWHVDFDSCGEPTILNKDGTRFHPNKGERVKRPAPKVLDADGVEVEVGDDLYSVEGMLKFHVSAIDKKSGRIATEAMFALDKWADPKMYTHRAPVLAADGKPLREGEHVYHVETGAELVVKELPKPGEYQAVVVFALPTSPASHLTSFDPDRLTHQRPIADTWERLEEDAGKDPCGYFGFDGEETCGKCPASGRNCEQTMARDLVRRAKALAERDAS